MPDKLESDKSKQANLSRRSTLKNQGVDMPDMPPCDAEFMLSYLWEIGPCIPAGMGDGPITHSEIAAWSENTGIELDAWQARTLRSLSIDYLNESQRAAKPDCPPPWSAPGLKMLPSTSAENMRSAMRALVSL